MMRTAAIAVIHACVIACVAVPSAAWAQAAGRFLVVVGDVRIVDDAGNETKATRGSELRRGDTIKTANRSIAQVRFADRGLVSVRSDSEMRLARFEYKGPNDRKGSIALNLFRGAMRSISGLIGRFNNTGYELRTPHATIGIRGTDHETTVLLKPRDGFQAGTFDQVFIGQTVMRTDLGTVAVLPKQAGFVGATGAARRPKLIAVPKFLKERPALPGAAEAGRNQAPAVKGQRKAGTARKRVRNKAALLNPLSSPTGTRLRTLDSSTTTLKTLDSTTSIRTLDSSTTLKTLDSSTTLKTLDSSTTLKTLDSSTTLKTLDSSTTLKTLDSSTTLKTLDSSTTLRTLDSSTQLKTLSPTTTTSTQLKTLSTTTTTK